MNFTDEQITRYSRHILLPEVGGKGQKKLAQARVLVVGAGGLGSPAILYLAAAGIGTIGIIDNDVVDLTNLQRQVIHHTEDLGTSKVRSAQNKVKALNPDVTVVPLEKRLDANNAIDIIKDYDIIVDGADNFPTKFLINDACYFTNRPLVHGAILRFEGRVFTILPRQTACYRCIFKAPPPAGVVPSCQEAGVIGVLAGVIGTIQATEVLKLVIGIGTPITNRLLDYDAKTSRFRQVKVAKRPECPLCGEHQEISELTESEQPACALNT
ncbi:MAG: adenylyltransferase [Nitrospiraceae bacterium]|nr:adenylyltransferase [Nitrospiraceae bacterium]